MKTYQLLSKIIMKSIYIISSVLLISISYKTIGFFTGENNTIEVIKNRNTEIQAMDSNDASRKPFKLAVQSNLKDEIEDDENTLSSENRINDNHVENNDTEENVEYTDETQYYHQVENNYSSAHYRDNDLDNTGFDESFKTPQQGLTATAVHQNRNNSTAIESEADINSSDRQDYENNSLNRDSDYLNTNYTEENTVEDPLSHCPKSLHQGGTPYGIIMLKKAGCPRPENYNGSW